MGQGFKRSMFICCIAVLFINLSITPSPVPLATGLERSANQGQTGRCDACHVKSSAPNQADNKSKEGTGLEAPFALQEEMAEKFGTAPDTVGNNRLNVLLLGVDTRSNDSGRADSIILASLDTKDYSAELFSIMRDSYVTIPTLKPTQNRINVAYGLGGPALVVKTVSNFLQVPINYYVVTDFQGFEKAVDAIGGVELNVEKTMNYTDDGINDIHLQSGLQQLNGHQALGYARFRHDQQGDYARVERQRKLLKAVLSKVQGVQAVYYLPRIINAIKPYIKTNLEVGSLVSLAYYGYKVKQVETHTIPSPGAHEPLMVDGMSVLLPNLDKTRREVQQILAQDGN